MPSRKYITPEPILDLKERRSLKEISKRYEKMTQPNPVKKVGSLVGERLPDGVKDIVGNAKKGISEAEVFAQAMGVVTKGFKVIEEQAARFSVSEKMIASDIDSVTEENDISKIEEICLARCYDITKKVERFKAKDLALAAAEGAATGAPGFPGIPFNLVLSTFIYFRAVQSVAMYYGYDIKGDSNELALAGEVFSQAMAPGSATGETTSVITKIMVVSEAASIREVVGKGWLAMANRGGTALLIVQMRALAHKAAQNALEKAGEKGLENSVFKAIFEQIGKRLTQSALKQAIPVVSAVVCALFDTAQMNRVIDFANLFYSKRFLIEKEIRIAELKGEMVSFEVVDESDAIETAADEVVEVVDIGFDSPRGPMEEE